MTEEAFVLHLLNSGFEARSSTPRELTAFMREESERLRNVIDAAGIRAE